MWGDQGGSGFGGQGGFSSPGGFGTPQASQEKKGRSRLQNLVPVTVAQLFSATNTDDHFYSGSLELSQVAVIGLIRSVKETSTRIEYEIDDFTGPLLDVKHFVDNDADTPEEERQTPSRENTYVRICGHVRTFQGKMHVVAFKILPVEDMNELTCHILNVIRTHASANMIQNEKGGIPAQGLSSNNAGDFGNANNYGMSALHNKIATIIKASASDIGVSIADVARQLKGVPEKSIRDAVEFLSGEGHIYSTIDDDHYKATDG